MKNKAFTIIAVCLTCIFTGALIGAITNMANGAISPLYFKNIMGWHEVVEKIRSADSDIVIVPAHNEFAARFIDFAAKHSLKTPKDYKLITFDDNPLYKSYNLTSLAIPTKEVGQVLGRLICDKSWLSNYRGRVSIKIKSILIVRDTFKPEII